MYLIKLYNSGDVTTETNYTKKLIDSLNRIETRFHHSKQILYCQRVMVLFSMAAITQ